MKSANLVALIKICFLEFNHKMVINEHPVHLVDSNILQHEVIFGDDFVDKCGFQLDYNQKSKPCLLNGV